MYLYRFALSVLLILPGLSPFVQALSALLKVQTHESSCYIKGRYLP